MLDRLNNFILEFLEDRSSRLADVYWRLIGKHIPYWM